MLVFPDSGQLRSSAPRVRVFSMWKYVERTILVLGFIAGSLTVYFTAGAYYGWNQPSVDVPTPTGLNPAGGVNMPPWWVIALGVLSIALLCTGWAMLIIRTRSPSRSTSPLIRATI